MSNSTLLPEGSLERAGNPREIVSLRQGETDLNISFIFQSPGVQRELAARRRAEQAKQALASAPMMEVVVEPGPELTVVPDAPTDETNVSELLSHIDQIHDKAA